MRLICCHEPVQYFIQNPAKLWDDICAVLSSEVQNTQSGVSCRYGGGRLREEKRV